MTEYFMITMTNLNLADVNNWNATKDRYLASLNLLIFQKSCLIKLNTVSFNNFAGAEP